MLLNNRYRILKSLGQGGFGKTFLVIDEKQQVENELCVIKQFLPRCHTVLHHQKATKLFHQESRRLAELGKHPQIPTLLDTFEQDGHQYLVQEWIDGQTLEQELAEAGSFNEAQIVQILQDILPVLQFVHDHQVIHRDIKPANILRRRSLHLKKGDIVLVDFGAAKSIASEISPITGTLIGSPEYAAPEQIRGKAVFASDFYSLGVTCLHLLTQMSPFEIYDFDEDEWLWRSHLTIPISPNLEKILCKLLQKAIKRRYQSAKEVLKDLKTLPLSPNVSTSLSTNLNRNDSDFETPYFG